MNAFSRFLDARRSALERHGLADYLGLLVMLVPGLLAVGIGLNAGEFWWTDEARHAMNSVFIYDFLLDGSWQAPMDYALRYFAQYPALALNWYPPGFYLAEGLFFQALGTSEFAGRLSVFAFFAVGLVVWYFWAGRIWGRTAAILSGLLFATNPQVVLWTRSLMLDTPATAMVILSVALFDRYLKRPGWASATWCGLAVAGALLVKQGTIFLVPTLLAYAVATRNGSLLVRRHAVPAMLLVLLATAFIAVHALKFGDTAVSSILGQLPSHGPSKFSLERWLVHPRSVAQVVGWPVLLCMVLGAWASVRQQTGKRQDWMIFLWIAFWYVTTTILIGPGNSARYAIYALPALALLAARGMEVSASPLVRFGVMGVLVAASALQVWHACQTEPRYVSGYREAARHILASPERGTILFAGKHDGNFVFHARLADPKKRRVILRGDKLLVEMSVHKFWGVKSRVRDPEEVGRLLDRYLVKYVVIERPDIVGLREFDMLAKLVEGPGFRLDKTIRLETNVPEYRGIAIRIYRKLDAGLPYEGASVTLPVMGREVRLPL